MITKTRVLPAVLWLGFFLVAAFPVAEVLAQSKDDIIAVFDIENRAPSFNEAALERLNDYLFFSLASAGFKLTPQNQVRQRVVELKTESHRDCYDETCQIELGKTVAAQKSLATRLILLADDQCLIAMVLYDLKTETTEKGAKVTCPCTTSGALAAIDEVIAGFSGKSTTNTGDPGANQVAINLPPEAPLPTDSTNSSPVATKGKPKSASRIGADYIEWFGMNLGGGYIANTSQYGRIDIHIATINWPKVYYTVLEGNVLPFIGKAGVGGRLGWRKPLRQSEFRIGSGLGFAFWGHLLDSVLWWGVDITPHFQIVRRYSHGTFGIGIDFPVYFGVFGGSNDSYRYSDSLPRQFTGGIHVYLRWSVF